MMPEPVAENMAGLFPTTALPTQDPVTDRASLDYFANRTLVNQALGAVADTVLFTVPTNQVLVARSMMVANNGGAGRTVTLKFVPSGQTVATWLWTYYIAMIAGQTSVFTGMDDVLEAGTKIVGWADVGAVVLLKINGVYVVGQ